MGAGAVALRSGMGASIMPELGLSRLQNTQKHVFRIPSVVFLLPTSLVWGSSFSEEVDCSSPGAEGCWVYVAGSLIEDQDEENLADVIN
jgi:hypothetical protein